MRSTLLAVLLCAPSALFAQPELLSNALPPIGTIITYEQILNFWEIDTTQQGAGVVWNFDDLSTYGSPVVSVFLDPSDTPGSALFPNANYARADNPSNYIYYYEWTDTHLDLWGRTALNNNGQNFVDPQRQLVFPMTLGTTNDDIYTGGSSGFYNIAGIGTGTLVLPSGTYTNVVMMRTIHSEYYHIYEWLSTENGALLLSYVDGNGFDPGVAKFMAEFSTNLKEHDIVSDISCVNPVDEILEIIFSSEMDGDLQLSLIDPLGNIIRSEVIRTAAGENRSRLFVGDLAKGCYMLTLRPKDTDSAVRTIRVVKQ